MGKLKNYTTKVPARRSIQEIHNSLADTGAESIIMKMEPSTGRTIGLSFAIRVRGQLVNFMLPVDLDGFRQALIDDRVARAKEDDYVYRVAWRCVRDWVMAQMALIRTQMAEFEQVFLPYAMSPTGQTVYQELMCGDSRFLLTGGTE